MKKIVVFLTIALVLSCSKTLATDVADKNLIIYKATKVTLSSPPMTFNTNSTSNNNSNFNITTNNPEDKALAIALGNNRLVSSHYGPRALLGDTFFHYGIDYSVASGTPVKAAVGGVIEHIGWENASNRSQGFGYYVRIRHADGSLGYYGHGLAGSSTLRVGNQVSAGTVIMKSGNTGSSTGPHLHFEVRRSQLRSTTARPHPGRYVYELSQKGVPVSTLF